MTTDVGPLPWTLWSHMGGWRTQEQACCPLKVASMAIGLETLESWASLEHEDFGART
jgi:hypothetical protein